MKANSNNPIETKIRLIGILKSIAGKEELTLKLKKTVTINDLIQKLASSLSEEFKRALIDSELKSPKPNALIILNGREISVLPEGLETKVKNGDEIVIVPVTHGG